MYKLALIGCGKMGGAILQGITKSNLFDKKDVLVVVRREEQKNELILDGYSSTLDVEEAFKNASSILLAIKPQMFPTVLEKSSSYSYQGKGIISIAAGIKIEDLNKYFPSSSITRAMPTTAALINGSVTTVCTNSKGSEKYEEALKVLKSVGKVVEIEENQMDTTLPLNGSMPAYIYYFIKCFMDASVKSGVSKEDAKELVTSTIISSTTMLQSSSEDIETLINNVCSKGGTTIAGLTKLYDDNFASAVEDCYNACKNRSIELGKK